MTNKLVGFGIAVMTTLLALVALWQFRIVVVYVLISLTLAATLRPLVIRLVGRGFVVRAAWILLYGVVLCSFGFLLFLISKTTIHDIEQLANTLSVQDAWRLPVWLGSSLQQTLVAWLPPPSKILEAVTGDQRQLVLPALLGFSQGIAGLLSDSGSHCSPLDCVNKRVIFGAQSSLTSARTYAARSSTVSWPGCYWAWVTGHSGRLIQCCWRWLALWHA
jgi:predicted PurR-regulated permease PerM